MKKHKTVLSVAFAAVIIAFAGLLFARNAFYGNCVKEEYTLYIYDTVSYANLRTEIAELSRIVGLSIFTHGVSISKIGFGTVVMY